MCGKVLVYFIVACEFYYYGVHTIFINIMAVVDVVLLYNVYVW